MKKFLFLAVAFTFVGIFSSSAQIVDNGYANACRFKDDKGQLWNGTESVATRTESNSATGTVSASTSASAGYKAFGAEANVSSTVGGSVSTTGSGSVSRTQNECCEIGNTNNCSKDYKHGHSELSKNADNSWW